MRKTVLAASMFGVLLSAFPLASQAQFGNLMDRLKGAAEKAQREVQQKKEQAGADQASPNNQQAQPAVAPPPGMPAMPAMPGAAAGRNPMRNPAQPESVDVSKAFRGIWCKATDASSNGSFDFKGIKTGDLCNLPDDLIVAIEERLKKSKQPFEWMTQPKVLNEGGSLIVDNVVAGERAFFKIAILIDPFAEKAYLGSFAGLVCAADPTNSLNADNPFRKALESKYGKPASAFTEYDSLKAQIDELEQQNSAAKRQAITVREARNARDVDNMLPTLKAALAASDKNAILSLTWDYEKGNNERPIGAATVTQARWNLIRDVGGCKVQYVDRASSGSPSLDYGFAVGVGGTKQIAALERSIAAKNQAKEKEKVQSAPAPKL